MNTSLPERVQTIFPAIGRFLVINFVDNHANNVICIGCVTYRYGTCFSEKNWRYDLFGADAGSAGSPVTRYEIPSHFPEGILIMHPFHGGGRLSAPLHPCIQAFDRLYY